MSVVKQFSKNVIGKCKLIFFFLQTTRYLFFYVIQLLKKDVQNEEESEGNRTERFYNEVFKLLQGSYVAIGDDNTG